MKNTLKILIIIIILLVLGVWAPWERYDLTISGLWGITKPERYGELDIVSLKDTLLVSIDGETRGEISPEGGTLEISEIEVGTHIIKLEKVMSSGGGDYYEYINAIDFIEDFNIVLAYELGPSREFSQGHLLYARTGSQKAETNLTNISIDTSDIIADVYIDDEKVGKTPLLNHELGLEQVHKIRVEQQGYENIEFSVLPEEQIERDKLNGVDLMIEAKLFRIPIEIENL